MPLYVKENYIKQNKILYNDIIIDKNIIPNHIINSTIAKLNNKNSNTDKTIYFSQDPYFNNIGKFIRNSTCWINGLTNISCFSPAQLSGALWNQRAGTLITKKHVLFAKHFTPTVLAGSGTPLIFVDNNNNVIRRNLIALQSDSLTDISIGVLDSEVPDNILIAKVLPINYTNYMNYPQNILCIGLDQEEKALLKIWDGLLNYSTANGNYQYYYAQSTGGTPLYNQYSAFSETIITGDSGNPVFIIIDNELVLLGAWHTNISGPFITNRYDTVNSLINSLSPNEAYSLTSVNLELIYHKYS